MSQTQQPNGLVFKADAYGSAPLALPGQLVFLRYLAQQTNDKAPGKLGGAFASAAGAAHNNAQLRRCRHVERGVAPSGGYKQPKLWQSLQQRTREGSALPHTHDYLEVFE